MLCLVWEKLISFYFSIKLCAPQFKNAPYEQLRMALFVIKYNFPQFSFELEQMMNTLKWNFFLPIRQLTNEYCFQCFSSKCFPIHCSGITFSLHEHISIIEFESWMFKWIFFVEIMKGRKIKFANPKVLRHEPSLKATNSFNSNTNTQTQAHSLKRYAFTSIEIVSNPQNIHVNSHTYTYTPILNPSFSPWILFIFLSNTGKRRNIKKKNTNVKQRKCGMSWWKN